MKNPRGERAIDKMPVQAIFEDVVLDTKQKVDEGRQDYLKRIVEEQEDKMSDEQYENLPEKAQDWLEKAIEAVDANKTIPDFPSVISKKKMVPEKEVAKEVAKVPNKKKEVVKKESQNGRATSVTVEVTKIVGANPKWTVAEIKEELTRRDIPHTDVTVRTVYSGVRRTLSILGYIK